MDRIDRSILAALQENARISNVDLATRVGLSASACLRRVAQLEVNHVIAGRLSCQCQCRQDGL